MSALCEASLQPHHITRRSLPLCHCATVAALFLPLLSPRRVRLKSTRECNLTRSLVDDGPSPWKLGGSLPAPSLPACAELSRRGASIELNRCSACEQRAGSDHLSAVPLVSLAVSLAVHVPAEANEIAHEFNGSVLTGGCTPSSCRA